MKFKTPEETDFWKSVFYETMNEALSCGEDYKDKAVAVAVKNADEALSALQARSA